MNIAQYFLERILKYKGIFKKDFIRFGIVGISANLIYFAIYASLFKTGLHIFLVALVSYAVSLVFTYKLSKNWTFEVKTLDNRKYKFRFAAVYFSSAIIMAGLITILVNQELDYRIAWLVGAIYAIIHNYIFLKYYTFK